jgi:HEAT repeat protein/CRP-like cAMP-binding protein
MTSQESKAKPAIDREQLKTQLSALVKGEESVFLNEGLMNSLPDYILHLFSTGKDKMAEVFVTRVSEGLANDRPEVRAGASQALSRIGRDLLTENHLDLFITVLPHWLKWIKTETGPSNFSLVKICLYLQQLAERLILGYRTPESNPILETFNHIYYGKIERETSVRFLAGDSLWNIATEDVMDILASDLKDEDESKWKQAVDSLVLLGGASIDRLLTVLQNSWDRLERMRILDIVSAIGEPAAILLMRKIEAGGPWYYIRNLVLMMGRVGKEQHLSALVPLFRHEDFRVQREALNSIYIIGGEKRGEILLSALPAAEDRMVLAIVEMLGAIGYEEAVEPLVKMIDSTSGEVSKLGEKLQEKICKTLGHIGSEKAIPALRSVVQSKTSPNIKKAAERAVEAIERMVSQQASLDNVNLHGLKDGNLARKEKSTQARVLSNDDTLEESVISILYQSIIQYARDKDFERAESLRDQMIETDPMALPEIIRSGEIIEEEKEEYNDLDADHMTIWSKLYDMLTAEEADALYEGLGEEEYEGDQTIFEQGGENSRLYFIRRGQLKMIYTQGERERLLKTVTRGNVVGEDTFFSINVCTTSLVTLSAVNMFYLDKSILETWKETHPALEAKLHEYCLRAEKIEDILLKKGKDRRNQKRLDISGSLSIQMLTTSANPAGKPFKGSLMDISVGGLSFLIKSSAPKTVSLLLGRKVDLEFDLPQSAAEGMGLNPGFPEGKSEVTLTQRGTIIGVSHRTANEYSVHIQFVTLIGEALSRAVKRAG